MSAGAQRRQVAKQPKVEDQKTSKPVDR